MARVIGSIPSPPARASTPLGYDDFYAYLPTHQYLFVPTRDLWAATSVDHKLPKRHLLDDAGDPIGKPVKASLWLDQHRSIEQMSWAPGRELVVPNCLVADGGWIPRDGCSTLNLYRPPLPFAGDAACATLWLDHVRKVYPDDADHLFAWLAHRVQYPAEKINHAIVLGGVPGIGKDSLLEPVKHAVGPWNFSEISPPNLMGAFNGFAKAVILRINEAHDLGEVNRYAFYDRTKIYTAAPPDVLRVNEKHLREQPVFNVCGVIITTNHKTDGLYLAPDDRRHYVAWSDVTLSDFDADYFPALYAWFAAGGLGHVIAWLRAFDLSEFDSKAPPPKTDAWREIVDANRSPEDAELADAIDLLDGPDVLTLDALLTNDLVPVAFKDWLRDRKNRRAIPHRLGACGYAPVRNPYAKDGLWVVNRRRQAVYAKATFSKSDRHALVVAELADQ